MCVYTDKKLAAVQRIFMYWERGWGPSFEKHLGEIEPFVIGAGWKFLPGLGPIRQRTPSLGREHWCSAAGWELYEAWWLGHHYMAISSGNEPSWRSFCFPAVYHSHPRAASIWSGVASLYNNPQKQSYMRPQRHFPSFSFWREAPEGDVFILFSAPRQEPVRMLEAKRCSRGWAWLHRPAHPMQPGRLPAICASNEQPINWLLKV